MYESTSSQFYQGRSETFRLESGWYKWYTFCTSGTVSFSAESSNKGDEFDVFAIPPDNPREFAANDGGPTYKSNLDETRCGSKDINIIYETCDVGKGAHLIFKNDERHTITISFAMYDGNPPSWPDMKWPSDTFGYDYAYLDYVRNLFN